MTKAQEQRDEAGAQQETDSIFVLQCSIVEGPAAIFMDLLRDETEFSTSCRSRSGACQPLRTLRRNTRRTEAEDEDKSRKVDPTAKGGYEYAVIGLLLCLAAFCCPAIDCRSVYVFSQ